MKVKCCKILALGPEGRVEGRSSFCLTVGKEYTVLVLQVKYDIIFFQIEDDNSALTACEGEQFEIVSRHIPSNWEAKYLSFEGSNYFLSLAPKSWNNFEVLSGVNFWRALDEYEKTNPIPQNDWFNYLEQAPEVVKVYLQAKSIIEREEEEQKTFSLDSTIE